MRILIMGGTRFIGVHLCRVLVAQGHEVVLFNRGNHPAPVSGVAQIKGDRRDVDQLWEKLKDEEFDAIFDNNGRELSDTQPLVDLFNGKIQQFIMALPKIPRMVMARLAPLRVKASLLPTEPKRPKKPS